MKFLADAAFDVVGLGVSTLDMFTVVKRFPSGREVQRASRMAIDGGGPVATASAALGRLGGRAAMLDCVGDDWAGGLILRDFARYNVDAGQVKTYPGKTSSAANILVEEPTGNRAIFYQPGSVPEITDIEPSAALIRQAKILHINGRHGAALDQAIRIAKQSGVKVSFDGGANRYDARLGALVKDTDICIVAGDFAVQYTGLTDLAEAARRLLADGPEIVGVTDGVNGSYIASRTRDVFHQPAFPMERVVDTTGCGDSYHGAFLYALTRGLSLQTCAAIASAVAAINTQTLGGRNGLPDLEQVRRFLAARDSLYVMNAIDNR